MLVFQAADLIVLAVIDEAPPTDIRHVLSTLGLPEPATDLRSPRLTC